MKLEEILHREKNNPGAIYWYKSGIFWRAYDQSAYLTVHHVKAFKIIKRYFKNVGKEVIYLGFPDKSVEKLLSNVVEKEFEIRKEEHKITIRATQFEFGVPFEKWWQEQRKEQQESSFDSRNTFDSIIDQIRRYPLVERTPFETQAFVLELQKKINGITLPTSNI